MKIGYVRCSSKTQNTARQEVLMESLGVDRVFIDICSGKNANRPQLQAMLEFMREGDTIVVESFSRLARSTKDLLDIADIMREKGVDFISQKEQIDTEGPTGRLLLTVLGGISQFEREILLERQREGIAIAAAEGKYKGRIPIQNDKEAFESAYKDWKAGKTTARVAMEKSGLKPNTFYRRVKAYEEANGIKTSEK